MGDGPDICPWVASRVVSGARATRGPRRTPGPRAGAAQDARPPHHARASSGALQGTARRDMKAVEGRPPSTKEGCGSMDNTDQSLDTILQRILDALRTIH